MEEPIKKEEVKSEISEKTTPVAAKKEKNIGMAVIAYIIFLLPLLSEEKNDPFVKYHIKQGLALFITEVAASLINFIPFIGWIVSPFIWLFCLVVFIIGIVNAVNGKEVPLPFIGKFGEGLKL